MGSTRRVQDLGFSVGIVHSWLRLWEWLEFFDCERGSSKNQGFLFSGSFCSSVVGSMLRCGPHYGNSHFDFEDTLLSCVHLDDRDYTRACTELPEDNMSSVFVGGST